MQWLAGSLLCVFMLLAQAEEFGFDITQYEKKPFELGGYLEVKPEYLRFNQDAALYQLNFPVADEQPSSDARYSGALELEGLYRFGPSSLNFRGHAEVRQDFFGTGNDADLFEFYSRTTTDNLTFELGKRVLKWGKGYAWNPVGFIERRKDPADPELSREGFIIASLDYVRSFDGPLKTLAFTPVLLPVTRDLNKDFSSGEDLNLAGKLYLLYRDTDIDLLFLTGDSHGGRLGLDFSRNLKTNLEIHGELAWINNQSQRRLDENGNPVMVTGDATSCLLGVRYLSAQDTTWILEYYHNSAGLNKNEVEHFYDLVNTAFASQDPALFAKANAARSAGFTAPNPMRDYLHLRASQKEPFDIIYLSTGLIGFFNLRDHSWSLIPEVDYTGFENTELRFRLALTGGDDRTEFGEKQNKNRIELRMRYFF